MNFKYLNADKKKTPKEQIRSKGVFNLQLKSFFEPSSHDEFRLWMDSPRRGRFCRDVLTYNLSTSQQFLCNLSALNKRIHLLILEQKTTFKWNDLIRCDICKVILIKKLNTIEKWNPQRRDRSLPNESFQPTSLIGLLYRWHF